MYEKSKLWIDGNVILSIHPSSHFWGWTILFDKNSLPVSASHTCYEPNSNLIFSNLHIEQQFWIYTPIPTNYVAIKLYYKEHMDVLFSKDSYEAEIVRFDVQPSIISLELITLLQKHFELISKLVTLNTTIW